jgi:hypothetical protein
MKLGTPRLFTNEARSMLDLYYIILILMNFVHFFAYIVTN